MNKIVLIENKLGQSCLGPGQGQCISCDTIQNKFLTKLSGTTGSCSSCDQEGEFRSGGNCLKCHSTCKTCNGEQDTSCLTCKDGLFIDKRNSPSTLCVDCQGSKEAVEVSSQRCLDCHNSCKIIKILANIYLI